jgi:hypothetical protein
MVTLSGYIAPGTPGSIRLSPSPSSLSQYIDIPQPAILHAEQNEESGVATLFVDPTAVLEFHSRRCASWNAIRAESLSTMVATLQTQQPDGGGQKPKSCVEKRIEKCKSDPTVSDKSFCDSEDGKRVFKIICDLFGDPKVPADGGVIIA